LRQWINEDAMTNDPGTLKITKAKFYRASGSSTQLKGVLSDIVLPSRENHAKEIGEAAIESALPYDKIEATRYDKENDVSPFKTELLARSSARVAKDRDYDYVRQDIEIFRKHQAMNSLSLNEQQRIKEWDEEDLRQRARKQERLARKASDRLVYEVTLAQAGLPGLSLASKTNAPDAQAEGESVASKTSTEDTDTPEETAPTIDPALDETQRILLDYISLSSTKGVAVTTSPSKNNTTQQ
jgi:carboxyl-terminal processing protease